MTNIPLRDRRHQRALADLDRLTKRRDAAITTLVRTETALRVVQLRIKRYEKPPKAKPVEPKPVRVSAATDGLVEHVAAQLAKQQHVVVARSDDDDKLEIPGFLRAGSIGNMTPADLQAMQTIEEQQQATRKRKSLGRVAKLKAKQAGDLDRMPLEGKAALAKIRAG